MSSKSWVITLAISSAFIPHFPSDKGLTLSGCGCSSSFIQKTIWWLCSGKEKTEVYSKPSLGFDIPTAEQRVRSKFLQRTLWMVGCLKPRQWEMAPLHPELRSLAYTEGLGIVECFCKTSAGWDSSLANQFSWIQEFQVQQEILFQKMCLPLVFTHPYPLTKHGYYTPLHPSIHSVFI